MGHGRLGHVVGSSLHSLKYLKNKRKSLCEDPIPSCIIVSIEMRMIVSCAHGIFFSSRQLDYIFQSYQWADFILVTMSSFSRSALD